MKKKIFALMLSMAMVMGMSITVCAAGSNDSGSAAEEAVSWQNETVTTAPNATGQVFTGATLEEFSKTTTVSGPAGASVAPVSNETAKSVIAEANRTGGNSVFIATIVDLHGGAGTYTLGCPNVWKGQKVTILHQKADGSYEYIAPSSVENNSVTFTLSSTSPIAVLIDSAVSPKTGEIIAMMMSMAAVCAGGAVLCGRKARN